MKLGPFELDTVVQGDCLELMKLLPDGCVDAVVTDLPYNEVNRESNGLRNLDKGNADIFRGDVSELAELLMRITSGSLYAFCGIQQLAILDKKFRDANMSRRCLVWNKTNPSPMNGEHIWLSSIEHCAFAKHSGATYNGFCKSAVINNKSGSSKIHPTEKPLELMKEFILTCTIDLEEIPGVNIRSFVEEFRRIEWIRKECS